MSIEAEMLALRLRCALGDMRHVTSVRVCGPLAFDALDALCPAELYLRDGQMLHTLLLRPDGTPLVDLYVCRDDEDYILLGEGLTGAELADYLRDAIPADRRPEIRDLGPTHRMLSLGGPWAWELMADLVGPGVVGLPYLTLFHEEAFTCFRAGKTGEFGYDLLVEAGQHAALLTRVLEAGRRFDLGEIGREALDQCALENWFFNIRREGRSGVTPLELQLQWRVSYGKEYPGSAVLRERRAQGPSERLTCLVAPEAISQDDPVCYEEQVVGRLVNTGFSPVRGDWIGLALLARAWAHAGIAGLWVPRDAGHVPVRTVAPPVIDNRSLFILPQKHSYLTREEHRFPPLFPGAGRAA